MEKPKERKKILKEDWVCRRDIRSQKYTCNWKKYLF